MAVYALAMLLSLLLAIYLPAALVRTAILRRVAEGFAWRENVAFIRGNLANYALSLVIGIVGGLLAQVGVIIWWIAGEPPQRRIGVRD